MQQIWRILRNTGERKEYTSILMSDVNRGGREQVNATTAWPYEVAFGRATGKIVKPAEVGSAIATLGFIFWRPFATLSHLLPLRQPSSPTFNYAWGMPLEKFALVLLPQLNTAWAEG